MRVGFLKIVLLVMLLPGKVVFAQDRGYLLKAAYIEKIINFVEWPNLPDSDGFVIAVYKNEAFAKVLTNFFSDDVKVNGEKVKVISINTVKQISSCQLLFIDTDTEELIQLLDNLHGIPVMTITDKLGFASYGAMINFYIDNNKIKFELNPNEFKKASLSVNYMLYKVAKIVKTSR